MRQRGVHTWLTALLCLTLIFRVLVPVGYMPDFEAMRHGIVRITICTGYGTQVLALDKDGGKKPGHHSDGDDGKLSHQLCPFAGANGLALGVAAVFLAALLIVWQRLRHIPVTAPAPDLLLCAAWPRGPPTIL